MVYYAATPCAMPPPPCHADAPLMAMLLCWRHSIFFADDAERRRHAFDAAARLRFSRFYAVAVTPYAAAFDSAPPITLFFFFSDFRFSPP